MRPQILDLFGEVPVYHQDIDAWLRAVPRIEPGSRRAAYYVEAWGVVEKIKAAKRQEIFEAITKTPTRSDHMAERFSWCR